MTADPPPAVRPLKVAHVIHSLGPGGAEHVLVDLAGAAPAAAIELVVVALSPVPDPVHARDLVRLGVPVVQLDLGRWDPRAVPRTLAVLREHGVQVVHTHLKHADIAGSLAAARLGVPAVSTLHLIESAPVRRIDRLKRRLGLVVRRRLADVTIAVSTAQQEWYRTLARADDVVVLPNGVADPGVPTAAARTAVRAALGVEEDGTLAVSASLMRPEKGHHLLLDALERLPDYLDLTVALAGNGPLLGELTARVERTPALRRRVRLLGYRDDVPALLGAADLVVHTSLADALPTTLIHALGVGVPAVATDVGGIADIVTPRTGLLVRPDAAEIAKAVEALATDAHHRAELGRGARERFLAEFAAPVWSARLRAVYESVLPGR